MNSLQAEHLIRSFDLLDEWLTDPQGADEERSYRVNRMPDANGDAKWFVFLVREGSGSGYGDPTLFGATEYAISHDSMRGIAG